MEKVTVKTTLWKGSTDAIKNLPIMPSKYLVHFKGIIAVAQARMKPVTEYDPKRDVRGRCQIRIPFSSQAGSC